jgi:molybdate transport system substrate-binding protein
VRHATALVAALSVALAGCGGSDDQAGSGAKPEIKVSAATSLKQAFTAYGKRFDSATARFSFAGSDELAAQIRQDVKPDVFAAANTKLPDQLAAAGKLGKPRIFAANRLVLAVPASGGDVGSLADLTKAGVTIAMGSPTVPIGSYTREVLAKLGPARAKAILTHVRSNEPDVGGVVGKLTQGAVDAGFVYVTDVRAAGGKLRAIEVPARLQPRVAYGVAVVKGAPHPEEARAFIAGLLSGSGAEELRRAGFEPPPG